MDDEKNDQDEFFRICAAARRLSHDKDFKRVITHLRLHFGVDSPNLTSSDLRNTGYDGISKLMVFLKNDGHSDVFKYISALQEFENKDLDNEQTNK